LTALHAQLKQAIERQFAAQLAEPVQLCRDALLLRLVNGVALELRHPRRGEYAIAWQVGDAWLRIDTAPVHHALPTANHLHDADGQVRADPLTRTDAEPWDNVRAVIDAVLVDPLLRA
jgi:hypothetical protein